MGKYSIISLFDESIIEIDTTDEINIFILMRIKCIEKRKSINVIKRDIIRHQNMNGYNETSNGLNAYVIMNNRYLMDIEHNIWQKKIREYKINQLI